MRVPGPGGAQSVPGEVLLRKEALGRGTKHQLLPIHFKGEFSQEPFPGNKSRRPIGFISCLCSPGVCLKGTFSRPSSSPWASGQGFAGGGGSRSCSRSRAARWPGLPALLGWVPVAAEFLETPLWNGGSRQGNQVRSGRAFPLPCFEMVGFHSREGETQSSASPKLPP